MENRKIIKSIIGCCISIFWAGTFSFGYPGVMNTYWQDRFHVGTSETGMILTFMLVALAVMMFFSGKIHKKVGMRVCILIGLFLTVLSFVILANARSIRGVYVWAFAVNLGGSFIYGPGLTTVQQWLPEKKGFASGLLNLVFGISAAITSPLLNRMLSTIGYEKLNLLLIAAVTVTYAAAAVLTETPKASGSAGCGRGMTVAETVKTKEFWIIWFIWIFMGAAGISMVSLSKNYIAALGIASICMLTSFNLTNGLVRIVSGLLTDQIGGERIGVIAFAAAFAGYLIMPHTSSLILLSVASALVGLGFGTLFTVSGPILSERFGLEHFGPIFGAVFTGYGIIAGTAGPALAGLILEKTGNNYTIVFTYLGIFALTGAVLMLILSKRTGPL